MDPGDIITTAMRSTSIERRDDHLTAARPVLLANTSFLFVIDSCCLKQHLNSIEEIIIQVRFADDRNYS